MSSFDDRCATRTVDAETGYDAWLRYAPLSESAANQYRDTIPAVVVVLGDDAPVVSAGDETVRGLRGMLGRTLRKEVSLPKEPAIVLGTRARCRSASAALSLDGPLDPDAYHMKFVRVGDVRYLVVTGDNDRGVLYGVFALLRKVALGQPLADLDERQGPDAPIRWVNQWDNLDGSIERGYGGRSIFWENGHARADLSRVTDYGRMLASIGINAVAINSVNANPLAISPDLTPDVARIAERLRPWGVRIALAIDFGSPKALGGLATYDPLDTGVIAWWRTKMDDLYRAVPDMAGVVLKADSEGRVGPSQYGRTHADAANVVARALEPHGGLIFYRGFVYDHHMDWQNLKNDRARAAYDNFHALDGKFDDNVVIQIKTRPDRFSGPRAGLAALRRARKHERGDRAAGHTGILRAVAAPGVPGPDVEGGPRFRYARDEGPTPVKTIVSGRTFHRPAAGLSASSNVGLDDELVRQSPVAGQSLWLRPPGLEPRPDRAADRGRVDTADLRNDAAVVRRSRHAIQLVAHLRKLHRAARSADPHRHRRQPLRRRGRGVRTQRLGAMAPRG